eukprot:6214723-Pleurochrysis_carterae.AAC.1
MHSSYKIHILQLVPRISTSVQPGQHQVATITPHPSTKIHDQHREGIRACWSCAGGAVSQPVQPRAHVPAPLFGTGRRNSAVRAHDRRGVLTAPSLCNVAHVSSGLQ